MFMPNDYLLIESEHTELYIELEHPEEKTFPGGILRHADIKKLIKFLKNYIKVKNKDIKNEESDN
jgi:hypothetical protein